MHLWPRWMCCCCALFAARAEVCINRISNDLVAVRGLRCPSSEWEPYRGAGANLFDALWDAERQRPDVSFADALHALDTFAASGLRYFRMFGKLYGRSHDMWLTEPAAFWGTFDRLIDAIEARRLHAIVSIELGSFGVLADEPLNALVQDSESPSRALARRYTHELTSRYRNRSGVLLWELTNELNLFASLSPRYVCDFAETDPCFDTDALTSFTEDMVATIRSVDSARPISSGFSSPRPCAWHLEHGRAKGQDTEAQWAQMLIRQHR